MNFFLNASSLAISEDTDHILEILYHTETRKSENTFFLSCQGGGLEV